eukprot:g32485.t1
MNVLTDLAKAGCTVICTLHQPSSEIFALIDQVICLCGGHCLWAGDRDHMASHFTKVGYPCPVGFNPADFVIFLMQTDCAPKTDELIRIWTQEQIDGALHRSSESGLSTGSTDEHEHEQQQQHELCRRAFLASFSAVQKSFGKQLKQLAKRELRAVVRDRTTLAVRQIPTKVSE